MIKARTYLEACDCSSFAIPGSSPAYQARAQRLRPTAGRMIGKLWLRRMSRSGESRGMRGCHLLGDHMRKVASPWPSRPVHTTLPYDELFQWHCGTAEMDYPSELRNTHQWFSLLVKVRAGQVERHVCQEVTVDLTHASAYSEAVEIGGDQAMHA
jgi:hypothetical protein